MPIPPPPMTFRCPACGWKQTTHPRSDALAIGIDCFDRCPRCGHEDIECEYGDKTVTVLQRLIRLLSR
ncbi:hypothetical protein SAMN02927929_03315 [Pseudomonas flexibilis]|nr:hypothetical protein SAMN02927929_03315 [Pseudomonas flexibilis]